MWYGQCWKCPGGQTTSPSARMLTSERDWKAAESAFLCQPQFSRIKVCPWKFVQTSLQALYAFSRQLF